MFNMKKKWIIIGVVVVLIVFISLSVWSQKGGVNAEKVKTASLHKQKIAETVMAPGKLKLADEQNVYFQEDKGEVDKFFVKEGDEVEKGDKLLRYKNQDLTNEQKQDELQLDSDYAALENARKKRLKLDQELEKDPDNEELQSKRDDVLLEEQQQNQELEKDQQGKESVEQGIADLTVKSDIDGTVVALDKDASSGAEQSELKPMVQIGSLDSMKVKGDISEYDTLKISKDQSVKLTSDAVPDQSWRGKIKLISDLPEESDEEDDDSGASYAVEAKVKDKDIPLKPGFKMVMEIETDKKKANVLPLTAVKQGKNTDYVYVVKDGTAKRQEVKTGITTNKVIEIKDGLNKKATIIVNPEDVHDGMDVSTS